MIWHHVMCIVRRASIQNPGAATVAMPPSLEQGTLTPSPARWLGQTPETSAVYCPPVKKDPHRCRLQTQKKWSMSKLLVFFFHFLDQNDQTFWFTICSACLGSLPVSVLSTSTDAPVSLRREMIVAPQRPVRR